METKEIIYVHPYYIMVATEKSLAHPTLGYKLDNYAGYPMVEYESWYGEINNPTNFISLNIKTELNYEQMKLRFSSLYKEKSLKHISDSLETFPSDFHQKLLVECIEYTYELLTSEKKIRSEWHSFYHKMIAFYDKLGYIIYASELSDTEYYNFYKPFISSTNLEQNNPFLDIELSRSSGFRVSKLDEYINNLKPQSVPANILVVGYYKIISNYTVPYLYYKKEWILASKIYQTITEKENNIIIGYIDIMPTKLGMNFKLRYPRNDKSKYSDARKIEKGAVCSTKSKDFLLDIASKLNINVEKNKIHDLCSAIKIELIIREFKAMQEFKKTGANKIRWFYFPFNKHINF